VPLKNKTNQLSFPFIYCRLGRSRLGKERIEKNVREREKSKEKNKKIERIIL
jgi:hypothetical protein